MTYLNVFLYKCSLVRVGIVFSVSEKGSPKGEGPNEIIANCKETSVFGGSNFIERGYWGGFANNVTSVAATFASPPVPKMDEVFMTPINAPPELQIVLQTPKSDINTLIWWIKRLHRERKISRYFEDYDHQIMRSAYALTEGESTLLKGFLGFYKEK